MIVLCYHALSADWDDALAVRPERFERQVNHWLRRGLRPLTFRQAIAGERGFAVTFDDAFLSVYEHAFPLLQQLGVPATLFVPTGHIDAGTLLWPGIEQWRDSPELRCMNWTQIDEVRAAGWEIGSHTVTHPRLTQCSDEQLEHELTASRERLDCESIAYPYGDVDARVVAAASRAGYTAGAALPASPGPQRPLEWPRIGVYRKDVTTRIALKELRQRRVPRARRLAVYTDQLYMRDADGLSTAQPFALFVAALRPHFDSLTIVGRLQDGRATHALPAELALSALPGYASATDARSVAGAAAGSLRAWWAVLGDADVVWLLGPNPLGIVFAALAKLRGRRVAIGVRQDLPTYTSTRHPGRHKLLWAARALDAAWRLLARFCPTVVVGDALAQRYAGAKALLDTPISLVGEREIGAPTRNWDGAIELLSVGRLDEEKNPLLLADIMRLLPERFSLTVCGDGPLAQELQARLTRGRLVGALARDELRAQYLRCHILVHVSRTEGVPQVLFEAFANGLAVVATDVGGVAAAAHGAALLVGPDDAPAAAQAIMRLAENASLRTELCARGLDLARSSSLEVSAARVAALLNER